ncbi:MAG: FIST C-terminal domain-containing protein, partial [Spirochaetaceae bacterium]|nr:FIST C-terminal domain-containing protein [Spirochaetaceae bacterium]
CDADTDGAALTGELKKALGFEIAGMTTLAVLDGGGHHEAAVVLTVLTADDCGFFASVSESLSEGDYEQKIAGAYRAAGPSEGGYGDRPGVIFAFCPYGMPFSGDRYPDILSGTMQGVPLMGGIASDDYDYNLARTFLSGNEYKDAMVSIGVWGNVKPAFVLRHVTSRFAERIRRVVEADKNIVYKVGDETFVKYLESFGLKTDVEDPLLAFTSYPMMLTREGGDETPLMRHICGLNPADGSGEFFGDVPTGTLANICLVSKEDIMTACRESMKALLEEINKRQDYKYSAVFCISCCGRAIILGRDAGAEGSILSEMLPPGISLAGAYCLGEICPARYKDGEVSNRFHNCSITFCML